ncbi:hypothetical protein T4D_14499 [Trichinella pseudospiralis]|uniref:Uncharacterized protein n=1 Tax=Trichinella pseudospiralis TaxID=6337 RepID=A0A0V1FRC9_TRIPS|nr:hypothetical protein T4D_14499 [Trichinella pseudospiralis]
MNEVLVNVQLSLSRPLMLKICAMSILPFACNIFLVPIENTIYGILKSLIMVIFLKTNCDYQNHSFRKDSRVCLEAPVTFIVELIRYYNYAKQSLLAMPSCYELLLIICNFSTYLIK